jgi:hypothetical protein
MKQFLILFGVIAFCCGCSDGGSIFGDATKTNEATPDEVETSTPGSILSGPSFDYGKVEGILQNNFGKLKDDLEGSLNAGEPVDYDRVRSLLMQTLQDQMQPPSQYQFIADANERWIYRCNLQTGKIECFSMTSNQLRLLSSYPK